jgi:hypothetical protein
LKLSSLIKLISLCLIGGVTHTTLGAEPSSDDEPLYIYLSTGNQVIESNQGLVGSILLSLGEIPNKSLKEKMDALLDQRNRRDQFKQAFGCLLLQDKSGNCRKVVFLTKRPFADNSTPSDEVNAVMQADAIKATWVLHIVEQFNVAGYFLNATASRIYTDEKGKQRVRRVNAAYWTAYSKKLDALQRSVAANSKAVTPLLGSKAAVAAFWYEGAPSRLESEVDRSPAVVADMLAVVMALPVDSRTVSPPEEFTKLPKLKTLESTGKGSCTGAYCGTRIRQESSDRILVEADWQSLPWLMSLPRWQE